MAVMTSSANAPLVEIAKLVSSTAASAFVEIEINVLSCSVG